MATKTIKPSGGDYTSLNAWEAGEQANITGLGPAIAECYSMLDSTAVVINGWTTTASDYIKIYTPTAERHAGVYTTSKYRMDVGANTAITINEDFVRVFGLQIYHSNTAVDNRHGIDISGTSTSAVIHIGYNILRGNNNGGWYDSGVNTTSTATGTVYIYNNIIYDWGRSGSAAYAGICINAFSPTTLDAYIYNNTIQNCHYGISRLDADIIAVNNLFSASVTADASGTFAAGTDYNATSRASIGYTVTGGGNTHDRLSQTFTFVDGTNKDFHLQSSDAGAKDYGVSDPGSGLFSDDIDGATRTGSWDIGADEYTAGGTSHALSGQADTVSTAAGALIAALFLGAASSATASAAIGNLTAGLSLNGQSTTVSTATGDLTVGGAISSHALVGQADTVSAAAGQTTAGYALSGRADTASTASANTLFVGHPLTGDTATTVSAASGTSLIIGHGLTGQAATTSDAQGTLRASYALSGQADTISTASGELGGGSAVIWQNFVAEISEPRRALLAESKTAPRRVLGATHIVRAALHATWRRL